MLKYLLNISILIFLFFILSSYTHQAHAQTYRNNAGYIRMLIQIAMSQYGMTTTVSSLTPTPTIYMLPKPTTTPTPKPTSMYQPTSTPTHAMPPSSISVTKIPTATPTPIRTIPTITPTPKPTNIAQPTPTPQPGDHMTFIMNEINKYRTSLGLSEVQTSTETCDFATIRAKEIVKNFNHDGFQQRIDAKSLPYANWTKITENIAMTTNYTQVVTMWKNSAGHAANMRAATPFVCVRSDGSYYAYEGMKP